MKNPSIRPDILTVTGSYFSFVDTEHNTIDIRDIAHSLAHICRFGGHTIVFYSVAQHSVLASQMVPPKDALAALLHDATEAYLGDVTTPLKQLLPDYQAIEARVQASIFKWFGLPEVLPASVKRADLVLLATERRDLMPPHEDVWGLGSGVDMLFDVIEPWDSRRAADEFFRRYMELTNPFNAAARASA